MAASEREEIISRIALSMSDSEAVRRLAEGGEEDFYPVRPVAASPSTEQAIDKFLETYGSGDAAETETLERLIFNPVADYSQQLAREEKMMCLQFRRAIHRMTESTVSSFRCAKRKNRNRRHAWGGCRGFRQKLWMKVM